MKKILLIISIIIFITGCVEDTLAPKESVKIEYRFINVDNKTTFWYNNHDFDFIEKVGDSSNQTTNSFIIEKFEVHMVYCSLLTTSTNQGIEVFKDDVLICSYYTNKTNVWLYFMQMVNQ